MQQGQGVCWHPKGAKVVGDGAVLRGVAALPG